MVVVARCERKKEKKETRGRESLNWAVRVGGGSVSRLAAIRTRVKREAAEGKESVW